MAKQKTGCLSCQWLAKVWAACLASTLIFALCSGRILRAADFTPSGSPPSNAITASLEYQETAYSVVNWGVSVTVQTVPFKTEPAATTGKIIRGVLNFGGGASNSIPFVWQRDAGKLFLDFNRNQDFSDDPAGVFSAREGKPSDAAYAYQTFTNVHLPLNTADGKRQVLADINLYDYPTRPSCTLAVRSFWQGKVTLHGRDWQVGIIENILNQNSPFGAGQLLLRPWEKRSQSFTAYGNAPDAVPFTRKIFVDGHAYDLDLVSSSPSNAAKPSLQFTEQTVALGELKIAGKFIQRLIFTGGPYLVLLDQPADVVKIPTGSYNQINIRLEQNGTAAFCNSLQTAGAARISVDDKKPTEVYVGGPLTNTVIASRHGEDLRLDYRLVGAGGETYQLANENRTQPPEFSISKGDKKIASGKFEFG